MIGHLEALIALADQQTMQRAARQLHITQSAVSKRIAALETIVGMRLIERTGRRVALTPAALRILSRARPLLGELKDALTAESADSTGTVVVAVSSSVLLSWGAPLLARIRDKNPSLELKVSSHTTAICIDRVRSGESMVALCFGRNPLAHELVGEQLTEETMVLVPSALKRFRFPKKGTISVMASEPHSETWGFIEQGLKEGNRRWGFAVSIERRLQTFTAIAQMARSGFGHGLVSLGVAKALGIPKSGIMPFPPPGLSIPVSIIGRRTTLARPVIRAFCESAHENLPLVV